MDDGQLGPCDVAAIRCKIWVNYELRDFWGYDTTVDVECGKTFFDRLPVRSPQENNYDIVDTFILPIDPHNTGMEIGSFFVERDPVYTSFPTPLMTTFVAQRYISISPLKIGGTAPTVTRCAVGKD